VTDFTTPRSRFTKP